MRLVLLEFRAPWLAMSVHRDVQGDRSTTPG